jgi:hypothetical protein
MSALLVAFFCFTPMFLYIPQVFRQNKMEVFLCIAMKSDLLIINPAVIGTQVAAEKCVVCSKGKNKLPPCLINPLNAELNPICHLLALVGTHHILHVSRVRVMHRIMKTQGGVKI